MTNTYNEQPTPMDPDSLRIAADLCDDWTNSYTTGTSWTADEIRNAMKAAIAAMPPKSERTTGIEAHPSVVFWLETRSSSPLNRFYGLPVDLRLDIPRDSWIDRKADGSGVMHYPNGWTVCCLPEPF